jgi:hypothetical protein
MTRRVLGALLAAAWLFSVTASAQVALGGGHTPGVTFQRTPEPSPPPPLSPPIAPGHSQRGHTAALPTGDLFLAGPRTYAPRRDHRVGRVRPYQTFAGYFPTPYLPAVGGSIVIPESTVLLGVVSGFLTLQVRPADAQVFVEGFYAGTAGDFSGQRYALEPGPHRIELRAAGYETVTVDVVVRPGQLTTYARELAKLQSEERSPERVVAAARVATPKTIYVIPRCYAGDRPPDARLLPAGCDTGALRVIVP